MAADRRLRLRLHDGEYAVCRTSDRIGQPALPPGALVATLTHGDEHTLVCPVAHAPAGADVEAGWRWLELEGPFAFDEVGVLAAVTGPLAAAAVPVFVLSTFGTDHVLVPGDRLDDAGAALRAAGHALRG